MTPATTPTIDSAPAVIGEAELRAMAAAIRAEIPGVEVRLFGSRARGEARPDSDVDLLITAPDAWLAEQGRWERCWIACAGSSAVLIYRLIFCSFPSIRQASGEICAAMWCTAPIERV